MRHRYCANMSVSRQRHEKTATLNAVGKFHPMSIYSNIVLSNLDRSDLLGAGFGDVNEMWEHTDERIKRGTLT